MKFGADGKLYIGTGQAGDEPSGEPKLDGLQGKMIRINDDGAFLRTIHLPDAGVRHGTAESVRVRFPSDDRRHV